MLHACFYTICFMFCYSSWRFYAFSGTNLLTRCQSASSLFSAVFVFQKIYTGNMLEIGRTKAEPPKIYRSFQKTEEETEGPWASHTTGWRGQPLAHAPWW
jgi:hypothetical protein